MRTTKGEPKKEVLDPELLKEEKLCIDANRLYRGADFYWHAKLHSYSVWHRYKASTLGK